MSVCLWHGWTNTIGISGSADGRGERTRRVGEMGDCEGSRDGLQGRTRRRGRRRNKRKVMGMAVGEGAMKGSAE